MTHRYLEDLKVGDRFESDSYEVTESAIMQFAREFDPQPFHLDHEAARHTFFKGLAASGWHTAAIAMSLVVKTRPIGRHPLIGSGVENLRWMLPVRPNDTLRVEGEVISVTPSKTKPQGTAMVKWTLFNQNSEAVYTFTPIGGPLPCRPRG